MFKIDLHVHTALGGDSVIQPQEVVGRARRLGLDAVCITEHHAYDLSQPFDEISIVEKYPVFRGLEYRAEEGHLLIYGVRAGKGDLLPGLPMQTAVDWVNRRGGAAIPAHPYQAGMVGRALGDRVLQLTGIAAVETLNGSIQSEENRRARNAARQLGVQGIGGSDAHGIQALGNAYTVFFDPIEDEAGLVKALHAGRYSPEGSSADQRFNISEPQKRAQQEISLR